MSQPTPQQHNLAIVVNVVPTFPTTAALLLTLGSGALAANLGPMAPVEAEAILASLIAQFTEKIAEAKRINLGLHVPGNGNGGQLPNGAVPWHPPAGYPQG